MSQEETKRADLANTLFPPPPVYYKAFTDENLSRADASGTNKGRAEGLVGHDGHSGHSGYSGQDEHLGEGGRGGGHGGGRGDNGATRIAGVEELEKPRADWVREEGRWMCFGQQYTSTPHIPTAGEIGLEPMTDPTEPPQTALPPLLHSFLHTLLLLVERLTETARIPGELEEKGWAHEGDQYIQHLSNLAATMMVSVNQLRKYQAESTLVMLMEKQVQARRDQTLELRRKCATIATTLTALRNDPITLPPSNGEAS